jgi:hypothetical protein
VTRLRVATEAEARALAFSLGAWQTSISIMGPEVQTDAPGRVIVRALVALGIDPDAQRAR